MYPRSSTKLLTVVCTVVFFAVSSFPSSGGSSQCNTYSASRNFTNYFLPFVVGIKPKASKAWNFTLHVPDTDLILEFNGQPTGSVTYTSKQKGKTKESVPLETGKWSYFDIFKENGQLHIYSGNISLSYDEPQSSSIDFSIETSGSEYKVNCQGKCGISSPKGFSPTPNHTYFLKAVSPGHEALVCQTSDHAFLDREWYDYTFGKKGGICKNVDHSSNLLIAECDPRDETSTYSTLSTPHDEAHDATRSTISTRIQEHTGSSGSHDSERDLLMSTLSNEMERDMHMSTLSNEKETYEDLTGISTAQDTPATVQEHEKLKNHAGVAQDHNTNMGNKATEGRDASDTIPAKGNLSIAIITIIFLLCLLFAAVVAAAFYRTRKGCASFQIPVSLTQMTRARFQRQSFHQPSEHVAGAGCVSQAKGE